MSSKRIHRSTTPIETDPSQSHHVDDENPSNKSRLLSYDLSVDHVSPSSSQPQSSMTSSLPRLQVKPLQLVDDGRSNKGFLDNSDNSYISPSCMKEYKLSCSHGADRKEFLEQCLIKLQQNDPTVLSLDLECQSIGERELSRFTDTLAINSTLLELSIRFNRLAEVVAIQLVEALKRNSTLTRLSLKDNQVDDAAATQLSDLLRYNTTLLSLDLSFTKIAENGISQLSAA